MATQTLDLKQSLHLRLSQRMQQAIKLLQMSNQELCNFVEDYAQDNPLLELQAVEDFDPYHAIDNQKEWPLDEPFFENSKKENEALSDLYAQKEVFENLWPDDHTHRNNDSFDVSHSSSSRLNNDDFFDPLSRCTKSESFRSFVLSQIDIIIDKKRRTLAYALCDLLNDDGILCPHWEEDIQNLFPNRSQEDIFVTLKQLQTLEPTGVFARSLSESLLIQLRYKATQQSQIEAKASFEYVVIDGKTLSMTLMEKILEVLPSHNGSPHELAKKLKISFDILNDHLDRLRSLTPRPSSFLNEAPPQSLIPDLIMHKNGQDEWIIELNPHTLPKVYLNSAYYTELRQIMRNPQDKSFLNEKYTEAKWLLKSLHQRALNILKVTDYMIRKQLPFFRSHQGALKPLTLKDVAMATQLSESTVSRVTTDKYIQTPRGLLELKYFFSTSLSHDSSTTIHSAKTIQHHIQQMIRQENQSMPLSDSDIVERLQIHDIVVARRTVAKYRVLLNIENASMRSKYYKWNKRDDKILAIKT